MMIASNNSISFSDLRGFSLETFRSVLRENRYSGHTAGLCPGLLQTNLVILPKELAADFTAFCKKNPKPCPLVLQSEAGALNFNDTDRDLDIRFDLPAYRVHRNGQFQDEVPDIRNLWQNDFVAFAIGCSFSFERALLENGITLRHIEQNKTVPMFRTNLQTEPAGAFRGPVVVSMRPIHRDHVQNAIAISETFPHAHGAPLHVGNPDEIGINDIMRPEWGEAVHLQDDEVPVFWGCGVTTQLALSNAAPDIAITHAPGAMLIVNARDDVAP